MKKVFIISLVFFGGLIVHQESNAASNQGMIKKEIVLERKQGNTEEIEIWNFFVDAISEAEQGITRLSGIKPDKLINNLAGYVKDVLLSGNNQLDKKVALDKFIQFYNKNYSIFYGVTKIESRQDGMNIVMRSLSTPMLKRDYKAKQQEELATQQQKKEQSDERARKTAQEKLEGEIKSAANQDADARKNRLEEERMEKVRSGKEFDLEYEKTKPLYVRMTPKEFDQQKYLTQGSEDRSSSQVRSKDRITETEIKRSGYTPAAILAWANAHKAQIATYIGVASVGAVTLVRAWAFYQKYGHLLRKQ